MNKDLIKFIITNLLMFVIMLVIVIAIVKYCSSDIVNLKTNSTVNANVEYVGEHNDSLVLEVKSLDSIKNVEIIQVESLDNDSTIKLFYRLISE